MTSRIAKVPGAHDASMCENPETPEPRERLEAAAELGAEIRALLDAVVRTAVPAATLRRVAAMVGDLVGPLTERTRPNNRPSTVNDLLAGQRLLNPVIGEGNPIAPPLHVCVERGRIVGECVLGAVYEGPHMYGHGGISALLLDQVLGQAAASVDNVGVTTGLNLRYRRPVPLDVPLRVRAEAVEVDGRRTVVTGAICTAADPDTSLVEADGTFLKLQPHQAKRIFAGSSSNDAAVFPGAVHDCTASGT